jgi:methionyl aminopeptidase
MVIYKTDQEIDLLRKSAHLVCKTLAEVAKHVSPGVSTSFLDKIAEEFIRDNGGVPGFKGYNKYPATLCTSVNSTVVHGIPSDKEILKDGDIVSVDCGVILNNYHGDSAFTFEVGEVKNDVKKLLQVTRECLILGLQKAKQGNRIGDIASEIQKHAEKESYSVVRELVGHGIGQNLHESPDVPNYGKNGTGVLIRKGLVICIEPMINMGKRNVMMGKDGWTISTADRKPSAHFELTVAVNDGEPDVLGTFDYIDEVLKK